MDIKLLILKQFICIIKDMIKGFAQLADVRISKIQLYMIYIPLERVKRFGKNLNTDLNPVLLTLSLFYVFSETCCTVNIVQIYLKFLKQESFESQLSSAQLIIQRFENDIVCI